MTEGLADALVVKGAGAQINSRSGHSNSGFGCTEPVGLADVGGQHAAPAQQVVGQFGGPLRVEEAVVANREAQRAIRWSSRFLPTSGRAGSPGFRDRKALRNHRYRTASTAAGVHRPGAQNHLARAAHTVRRRPSASSNSTPTARPPPISTLRTAAPVSNRRLRRYSTGEVGVGATPARSATLESPLSRRIGRPPAGPVRSADIRLLGGPQPGRRRWRGLRCGAITSAPFSARSK